MITVNFSPQVDTAKMSGILQQLKSDPMGEWIELPGKVDAEELARIKAAAKKINEDSEYLVCIGIGGSYLGHRAVIEALRPELGLKLIYAGKSLSRRELEYTYVQKAGVFYDLKMIVYTVICICYALVGKECTWILDELKADAARSIDS